MIDDRDLPEFLQGLDAEPDTALAAALAVGAPQTSPPAALRGRLLASATAGAERYAPFLPALSDLFDLAQARVREIVATIQRLDDWEPGPLPGMQLLHFAGGPRVAHADTGLVALPPGFAFPQHRHLGREQIFILSGGYRDSSGTEYGPGTLHEMLADTEHAYTVLPGARCVFAVVLETGIEIDGVGRVGGK